MTRSILPRCWEEDGTIYVGSMDHHVYAVKPEGPLRWTFNTREWMISSPAIGRDGVVYVGSYNHNLYALSAGGID